MKARMLCLGLIFAFLIGSSYAEEAITLSGKRVILHDDGTWEYKKIPREKEVKFRGIPWGATAAQVKKQISEESIMEEKDGLMYQDKLNELSVYYAFIFANDRFVRGNYAFAEEHANKNAFIWDFESIEKLLKEKYKEPIEHKELWLNDLYKDIPQDWGMAVSVGHYAIHSKWKVGKVTIFHILRGDNYNINHLLQYSHEDMALIEQSLRKEKEKEKI